MRIGSHRELLIKGPTYCDYRASRRDKAIKEREERRNKQLKESLLLLKAEMRRIELNELAATHS